LPIEMDQLMRILIVSNSLSGGGAERSMRIINTGLGKVGIDSTLVCLNNSGKDVASEKEIILERAWKSGIINTFKNFRAFRKIVRDQSPNLVIANCELPELFVALIPFQIENLICVEHTSRPWAGRRAMGVIVRLVLKIRGTEWVTVNRGQAGIWPFREESAYIPNPVGPPLLGRNPIKGNEFVYLGRLRPEKGIETILEAVAEANAKIDVFGSGNLENSLRDKFQATTNFFGFQANAWTHVSRDQTLIVASEYEGDGMVIVEGILAGLPILLLDNNDLRRFALPDSNYFKTKTELVEKINRAKKDCEQFRVGAEKTLAYKSERALENVLEKWLRIIR